MAVWDQMLDESNRWYARFERYRLLGPKRSLEAVFRKEAGENAMLQEKRPGQAWYRAAARFDWAGRAAAWDAAERERIRGIEAERRFDERERRLALIDKVLASVERAFDAALVGEVTTDEARGMLPTVRLFLRDLMAAQRDELAMAEANGDGSGVEFTSEDFAAAARAMGREACLARLRDVLAELYPDESSSRRIAQAAGLNLGRVRFQATAVDTWHAILTEAEHAGQVEAVIAVVGREYGANVALQEAVRGLR